jgi:hypothetical protein
MERDYINKYEVDVSYINGKIYETIWYSSNTKRRHRLEGPAEEFADGTKFWRINGLISRLNGPAVEYPSGNVAYYIDGEYLTPENYIKEIARRNTPTPPPDSCDGKVVEIEGKKYQLKLVD